MKLCWAWQSHYQGVKWVRFERVWQKRQWCFQVYKLFISLWY